MGKFIISFLLIIIGLSIIKFIDWRKKYQFYDNRLKKTNDSIKDNLLKKYDLLNKQIKSFKNKKKLNIKDYQEYIDVNEKELKVNELDNLINELDLKLNKILQDNHKLIKENPIKKNTNDIEKINITINSLKKYYNNLASKYNKYLNKFPTKIVGKIYKYKEANLYNVEEKK